MIRSSKLAAAGIAAVVLIGTAWIANGWIGEERDVDPVQTAALATPEAADDHFDDAALNLPPAQTFSEIVRRPIFSPDRRPAPEGELTLETAAANLDIDVVGVIIASGEQMALIAPRGATALVRLAQGDRFQGWTVDTIEAHRVRFRRDGAVHDVEISYDKPPKVVPTRQPKRETAATPPQASEKEQ